MTYSNAFSWVGKNSCSSYLGKTNFLGHQGRTFRSRVLMYPRASPFANPPQQGGAPTGYPPPPMAAGQGYQAPQAFSQQPPPSMGGQYAPPQMMQQQAQPAQPQFGAYPPPGAFNAPSQAAPQLHGYDQGAPPTLAPASNYRLASHTDIGGSAPVGLPHIDASLEASLRESEEFNAPSHFVRSAYSRLPSSSRMAQGIRGPMGLSFQPLAPASPEPPTVNFSTVGSIVRCRRCRTYINPFVVWEASGRRWTCNLCGFSNETLNTYFGPLDASGRRADRYEHPELCNGSVDYIAPAEYMVRPPQPPVLLFLIDVTSAAMNSGLVDVACASIRELVAERRFPGGDRCQIGIMTFDSSIHFYNLAGKSPQMMVVNDFEETFEPTAENVLVNASERADALIALVDTIPTMFRTNKAAESCLGSAVKTASFAMKHVGGKLVIIAGTIPSLGDFGLTSRKDNSKLLNTDREIELLKPSIEGFKDLATELTKVQICCDLFVATSMYMDLASIAPLAKLTAGDLRYYPAFSAQIFGEKLRQELLHVCTRPMGWEAVMRVRVSRGWKIAKFFGHLYVRGVDLLVVPNCHQDQTFGITIEPVENETPDPNVCVQFALLYTNSESERRIRVHTIQLVSTPNVAEVYSSLDAQVMGSLLGNLAMEESVRSTLAAGRNLIHTTCQQVASAAGPSNPAIPNLAMYAMGLLKSGLFRATMDVPADLRVYYWNRFETVPLSLQTALMYPCMYALQAMEGAVGSIGDDQRIVMPDQLPLSVEMLTQDGVALIEDGEQLMMWIGTGVSPAVLSGLFGVQAVNQLNVETAEQAIGTTGQVIGQKVAAIVAQLRQDRMPTYMSLQVLPHEHPFSPRFFQALVEDRTAGLQMTYQEFLQRLGIASAGAPTTSPAPQNPGLLPPSYR